MQKDGLSEWEQKNIELKRDDVFKRLCLQVLSLEE